jgi:hypothetical protein
LIFSVFFAFALGHNYQTPELLPDSAYAVKVFTFE